MLRRPRSTLALVVAVLSPLLGGCASAPPPETRMADAAISSVPRALVKQTMLATAMNEWRRLGQQRVYWNPERTIIDPVGIWEDEGEGVAAVAAYWASVGRKDSDTPFLTLPPMAWIWPPPLAMTMSQCSGVPGWMSLK